MNIARRILILAFGLLCVAGLQAGNLRVNLSPSQAVSAGAQWRVDGGPWKNSGATVNNLSNTTHQVTFKAVTGWLVPATVDVALTGNTTTTVTATYVSPAALKINLTPSSGQWRIDSGVWRASGATVTGLAPGAHTVNYASVSGYASPAGETITLVANQTTTVARNYAQLAQVAVTLTPSQAQWRVDGGAWQASGVTVANLTPGPHTISYSSLTNWATPANENVTLAAGQSLNIARAYVQLAQIIIGLVPSSGQWRVNGGAWNPSGTSLMVMPGNYIIEYAPVTLFDPPVNDTFTLAAGGGFATTRYYTSQKPSLRVSLAPNTGQWRMDGGAWQPSGTRLTELNAGSHTIDFTDIGGLYAPIATETVSLALRENATFERPYPWKPGSVTVNITPAGAQWRVFPNTGSPAGVWQNSGATAGNLAVGGYIVEYASVPNHVPPSAETITIAADQTVVLTRAHTAYPAQFRANLTPNVGKWRIYPAPSAPGGAWTNSGLWIGSLTPGTYTVEYSALTDYDAPPSETVTLSPGLNTEITRSYIAQTAQLSVTLTPAGAQWRVDGGTWQNSGATVAALAPGAHTISYAPSDGYTAPVSETITLVATQTTRVSRSYAPLAQIVVTLTPASGQWRIDSGTWQNSGAAGTNLTPGVHTLGYAPLDGHAAPASELVTLVAAQTTNLSRSYTPLAQVTVTLTPSTAQWRIDGGAWLPSGATIGNLASGAHAIDYAPLSGYTAPAPETVTLVSGDSLPLARSHGQLAQVAVTLTPTNAQWRIDGGAWQASGATVANLALGTHAIEYAPLAGHVAPANESVTLTAGQSLSLSRSLVPLAQLAITLTPAAGQWRIDGGAWQASGATVANLAAGNHTIDYSTITQFSAPAAETVALTNAQSLALQRNYTQLAQIIIGLVPASGQWRANGGAWQASGNSIFVPAGDYTIEYSPLDLLDPPANDTLTLTVAGGFATTRYYTSQRPTLRVILGAAGAQWRLDGGAWQANGTELLELATGPHPIDYSDVGGDYAPLASETVTLNLRDHLTLTRTYPFKPASVTATLSPGWARWRVSELTTTGWQPSGATLGGIPPGNYTIAYEALFGYDTPASDSLTLAPNQPVTLNHTYGAHPGTIAVTLNPPNGLWRVYPFNSPPGGAWHYTGEIVAGLMPGSYTLDYSVLPGYDPLPAETVTLTGGQTASYTRNYVVATPPYAIIKTFADAGATPAIIRGSEGVLYVATTTLGSNGAGQIFRLNPDGSGYTVLKAFINGANTAFAPNSLIEGSDHVLYGTTQSGGINTNNGTVFRMNKDGSGFVILKSFDIVNLGSTPNAICEGSDGLLYGTTASGGTGGRIFKMSKDGSGYTMLYSAYGARGVIEGPGGALYAATSATNFGGIGSLFKINKDGSGFVLLKNFAGGADGATPRSVLLVGSDGVFYGTTSSGGTSNKGLVFRINVDGTGYLVLRNFLGDTTDGGRLDAPLTEGPGSVLYGATFSGGSASRGTVFRMNKDGSGYAILRHFQGTTDGGALGHRVLVGTDGIIHGATATSGGDTWGVMFRMHVDGTGFATIRDFGAPDGSLPISITEASDGALYGITYTGGGSGKGVVFKVNKSGTGFTALHRFANNNDGVQPLGQPIEASDGMIYGTTLGGYPANGILFRVGKDGSGYAIVHAFGVSPDGWGPASGVIEGSDGALYGTTIAGGSGGYGAIYRINKDGSGHTVLRSFANASVDGHSPAGALIEGPNDVLYGTTSGGGSANLGTVFALNKDGANFAVLHHFAGGASDGSVLYSGLYRGSDGRIYGTTTAGGSGGKGTVFGLNADGSGYAVLKNFTGGASDGAVPYYGGVVEKNGALYGLTKDGGSFEGGTLFKLNKDGTGFTILINFGVDRADGRAPSAGLFKGSDGTLYGATGFGGSGGTVFRLRVD